MRIEEPVATIKRPFLFGQKRVKELAIEEGYQPPFTRIDLLFEPIFGFPYLNKQVKAEYLIEAIANNDISFIKALIKSGGINLDDLRGDSKQSALLLAAEAKNLNLVKFFLACGSDLQTSGKDALAQSIFDCNYEITEFLISKGVRFNKDTALTEPCRHGDQKITKLLLDNGANPNSIIESSASSTALLLASSAKQAEIIKLLLEYGADINFKNRLGKSVLDQAFNYSTYQSQNDDEWLATIETVIDAMKRSGHKFSKEELLEIKLKYFNVAFKLVANEDLERLSKFMLEADKYKKVPKCLKEKNNVEGLLQDSNVLSCIRTVGTIHRLASSLNLASYLQTGPSAHGTFDRLMSNLSNTSWTKMDRELRNFTFGDIDNVVDTIDSLFLYYVGPIIVMSIEPDKRKEITREEFSKILNKYKPVFVEVLFGERTPYQILKLSQKWHQEMNRVISKIRETPITGSWFSLMDDVILKGSSRGYLVTCLDNSKKLASEGNVMSNCVASQVSRCQAGEFHILSMRDPEGRSVADFKVSILETPSGTVPPNRQIKANNKILEISEFEGLGNATPPQSAFRALDEFISMANKNLIKFNTEQVGKTSETEEWNIYDEIGFEEVTQANVIEKLKKLISKYFKTKELLAGFIKKYSNEDIHKIKPALDLFIKFELQAFIDFFTHLSEEDFLEGRAKLKDMVAVIENRTKLAQVSKSKEDLFKNLGAISYYLELFEKNLTPKFNLEKYESMRAFLELSFRQNSIAQITHDPRLTTSRGGGHRLIPRKFMQKLTKALKAQDQ